MTGVLTELSEAERAVVAGFESGQPVETADEIRADVLAALLLGVAVQPSSRARISLAGASITGSLELAGVTVCVDVSMDGCRFDSPIVLSRGTFAGFRLTGCQVSVFDAAEASFARSLLLRDCQIGQVTMPDAKITGNLALSGTTADWVNLTGARVSGEIVLQDTKISATDVEPSLSASGVIARRFYANGLTAHGVSLVGAKIGSGGVDFTNAQLTATQVPALNAEGIETVYLWCRKDFTATGKVHLYAAKISQQLDLTGTINGAVEVCLATAAQFRPPVSAPSKLDGLEYQQLDPYLPAKQRLQLLARDPDHFRPGPYEQLAAYYRRLGTDDDARLVQLAKRRARRRHMKPLRRLADRSFDLLTGYGYQPARAAAWFALVLAAGATYFASATPAFPDPWYLALDLIVPTSPFGAAAHHTFSGASSWVAAGLQTIGWVLSFALLPAVVREIAPQHKN